MAQPIDGSRATALPLDGPGRPRLWQSMAVWETFAAALEADELAVYGGDWRCTARFGAGDECHQKP
jgi:hypothetical protein